KAECVQGAIQPSAPGNGVGGDLGTRSGSRAAAGVPHHGKAHGERSWKQADLEIAEGVDRPVDRPAAGNVEPGIDRTCRRNGARRSLSPGACATGSIETGSRCAPPEVR